MAIFIYSLFAVHRRKKIERRMEKKTFKKQSAGRPFSRWLWEYRKNFFRK